MSSPVAGPDLEAWRSSVAGVLAKSQRKDPAEMPADAWRRLSVTTRDGIEVDPLYTRADELPERPAPGTFPFVRGGSRAGAPENGWHVVARVDVSGRGEDANTEALALLGEGASALWLHCAGTDPAADLVAAVKGVYLDLAPVVLDAGAGALDAARAYLAEVDARAEAGDGVEDRASITCDVAASPLSAGLRGAASVSLPDAVAFATSVAAARGETIRTFVADGSAFHDLGAGDAQQLGYAVAEALAYVRTLVDAGMPAADALGQVSFRLSASDDQFQSIATFRAARLLWARVAEALGEPGAGAAAQHAVTSLPMMTRRDPWVNMLRTTLAAFGAGVGGATGVTVLPFDAGIPGGLEGTSRTFAERMARNTQLLLLEESHLGHVLDPAGGSWYVESLTDALADKAWAVLQEVEAAGGLAAAIDSGAVSAAIDEVRAARDADIARRKVAVTGVSEFPRLDEPALDADRRVAGGYRYGQDFEALRDRSDAHLESTGARPTVLLAGLGSPAQVTARVTFVANLLAAGGIEGRNPGVRGADDYAAAVAGETVAVLCGPDPLYAESGAEAVSALRAAGIDTVYVAGREKGFPATEGDGRPDGFLGIGIDAVAALTTLLTQLGVQ